MQLTASAGIGHGSTATANRSAWPILLGGGLLIAAIDLACCILFWSPQSVAPIRLLQGIAAGALGEASFGGGAATALLGAGLQWLIGCVFVLAYALVARHVPLLRHHPRRYGVAYGMALYVVMNLIVVPLSAAPTPVHPNVPWMLCNLPMFAVFGAVAALFAVRSLQLR